MQQFQYWFSILIKYKQYYDKFMLHILPSHLIYMKLFSKNSKTMLPNELLLF